MRGDLMHELCDECGRVGHVACGTRTRTGWICRFCTFRRNVLLADARRAKNAAIYRRYADKAEVSL